MARLRRTWPDSIGTQGSNDRFNACSIAKVDFVVGKARMLSLKPQLGVPIIFSIAILTSINLFLRSSMTFNGHRRT